MNVVALTLTAGVLGLTAVATASTAVAQKETFTRSKPHVNVQARTLQAIPLHVRPHVEAALTARRGTSASILDTLDSGCGVGNWIVTWSEDEDGNLVEGSFDYACIENP